MSQVEPRYAEALLAVMPDAESADNTGDFMDVLLDMLTKQADVNGFFSNPTIPKLAKKDTIYKILESSNNKYLLNFMCLLIDKGRLNQFPIICEHYKKLKNKLQKKLEITVYSGFPLDMSQLEHIRDKYMKKYGSASAAVTEKIDPKYLGGIQVQIGDVRTDDTLSARLDNLRSMFTSF